VCGVETTVDQWAVRAAWSDVTLASSKVCNR
jgi:hypothetical protein